MPALLETAVRPVIWGFASRASISVSGTPQRPKPPARRVLLDLRSLIASAAEGKTRVERGQLDPSESLTVRSQTVGGGRITHLY